MRVLLQKCRFDNVSDFSFVGSDRQTESSIKEGVPLHALLHYIN
jgi:hypothetical protein